MHSISNVRLYILDRELSSVRLHNSFFTKRKTTVEIRNVVVIIELPVNE